MIKTEKSKEKTLKTKGSPTRVDEHVGSRLRQRRTLLGWSQEKLADAVDITFQQVQKYERGLNRVSASRLFQFSQVLDVPVSYFFDDYAGKKDLQGLPGLADTDQENFSGDSVFDRKETIDLIRTYYSIRDPKVRRDLHKLIKSMAASSASENS